MSWSLKAVCLLILFISISGCAALMPPPVMYGGYGGYAYPSPQPNSVAANGYYNQSYGYNSNYPPQYNNGTNGAYSGYHYVQPQNVAPVYTPAPTPATTTPNTAPQYALAPPKTKRSYPLVVPVSRIKIMVSAAGNYTEYLPAHTKLMLTKSDLSHLAGEIRAMRVGLGRTTDGAYEQFDVLAKPKDKLVARPLAQFSSDRARPFNISALRAIFWKISRLIKNQFYRYNIRALIVPQGLTIYWSSGVRDFRHGRTGLTLAVVLVPYHPFLPDRTVNQFVRHGIWMDNITSPIIMMLNQNRGLAVINAGNVSPRQNLVIQATIYRQSSRFRRAAMDWDFVPMPHQKLLRLAGAGNIIAKFELAQLNAKRLVRQPKANSQNTNHLAPTEYRLTRFNPGGPRTPTVREMRELRDQARTSWTAFYQLDTYAVLPRGFIVGRSAQFEAARYYMGTLFDPRRTYNECVAPKSTVIAEDWYRWASLTAPVAPAEQKADGIKNRPTYGQGCKQIWNLAQTALGTLYATRDTRRAYAYTLAAAKAGVPTAMNNLAALMTGMGISATAATPPQRAGTVHRWLLRAAMRGDATAERNLACYWKRRALLAVRFRQFGQVRGCYKKAITWFLLYKKRRDILRTTGYSKLLQMRKWFNTQPGVIRRPYSHHLWPTAFLSFNKHYALPRDGALAVLRWYCTHAKPCRTAAEHYLASMNKAAQRN